MSALDILLATATGGTLVVWALGGRHPAGILSVLLYAVLLLLLALMAPALEGGGGIAGGLSLSLWGLPLHWRMTGLGWFFALITVGAALASAAYAAGHWGAGREESLRLFHTATALNVLAMLVLLASGDLLSLFIGWELVTWAGFLIMTQQGGPAADAAYRYVVYATAGAMAILAALVLTLQHAGALDYATVRASLEGAPAGLLWTLVMLFGAGFAVKMALVPLHLWQAEAYAETPGPAAAFLSAISARMGLFAMLVVWVQLIGLDAMAALQVPFTFLDARTLWAWVGAITMVVPTFIALTQTDARMLLAWHGIGQGGYMIVGILIATPMGVAGGLLHVLNHASYQAALFLAVTAVAYRTGTSDLDRLGGLIGRMPFTYVTMLLGIIGLAGLPPMNGFVSKWLIYKALLDEGMPLLFVAAVIGTLGTILSVYKLIHNTFLGQLRAEHAEVREAPLSMVVPMLALGGFAFATGMMPGLALTLVDYAQAALGLPLMAHHLGGVTTGNGSLNMLWVGGALLGAVGAGAVIFWLGNRRHYTHQLDNYAGGHFLSSDIRFHYSHNFYPGAMRALAPLYRGSVQWLEGALATLTGVLSGAMHGLYRNARPPLYLLVVTVLGLWWALSP